MANDKIVIKGACEHNLKCIDVEIPRDRLVVITGISGSGKSTLAFDTIYAEGQRRYVESLSAYARQFLEQMEKPDVESIEGLSPAISIEQKTTSKNPRSTVGTVTEIYDYLRLLFARIGKPHCYSCGKLIASQTVTQMVDQVMALPEGTKFSLLSPMVRGRKGEYKKELSQLRKDGFVRVIIDGTPHDLADEISLDSRDAIFKTYVKLHPILKDEYFINPAAHKDDEYESSQIDALIANPCGIFGMYSWRTIMEYEKFWAIGSGREFALGAMYSVYEQLTAEQIAVVGVQAACEFDDGSGLPYTMYTVQVHQADHRLAAGVGV